MAQLNDDETQPASVGAGGAPALDADSLRKLISVLPSATPTPQPQLPVGADPSVAQAAQDRLGRLAGIQGLAGLRTVTPYDVKQGIRPTVASSPGYEAARQSAELPVAQEQARVNAANAQSEVLNKWMEANAGRAEKSQQAGLGLLGHYLAMQGMLQGKQIGANATLGAAQISAKAKLDAIKAQIDSGQLSPEAIERFAEQLNTTGQMPRIPGRGVTAAVQGSRVANRAAQTAGNNPAPLASAQANYGANKASLSSAQKLSDATDSQEATASKNLDQFMGVAQKMSDAGSPILNKPLRWLEQNSGDPQVAAFSAARQVAATEVARVLQNGSALTDSARHEIGDFAPATATGAQLMAVTKIIKQDMANRQAAQHGQVATIKGRIGGQPQPSGAVTIRRKRDGVTKTLSADAAAKYLSSPDFEQVQ